MLKFILHRSNINHPINLGVIGATLVVSGYKYDFYVTILTTGSVGVISAVYYSSSISSNSLTWSSPRW